MKPRDLLPPPTPLSNLQFTASYGLVLNLLSVYTLEEARAFVQRSFGNFLQTEGQRRRLAEAAKLEADAREFMAEYKESASSDANELSVSQTGTSPRRRVLQKLSSSFQGRSRWAFVVDCVWGAKTLEYNVITQM